MTFKFRKGILIYLCIMSLICAFFSVAGMRQSGFNADSGVFVMMLIFLLICSFVACVICMDLVVDNNGICRIFFGKPVLFLKWSDIKTIKDVVKKSMSGQSVRSFYVIPSFGVSLSFWSGGWIRFPDNMYEFPAFVDAMNKQVRLHNIRIERVRGIDIVICDEISI
jgi:hypothetical protein